MDASTVGTPAGPTPPSCGRHPSTTESIPLTIIPALASTAAAGGSP